MRRAQRMTESNAETDYPRLRTSKDVQRKEAATRAHKQDLAQAMAHSDAKKRRTKAPICGNDIELASTKELLTNL